MTVEGGSVPPVDAGLTVMTEVMRTIEPGDGGGTDVRGTNVLIGAEDGGIEKTEEGGGDAKEELNEAWEVETTISDKQ